MSVRPIELLGGESVYCINQAQLRGAFRLAEEDPQSGPRIQAEIAALEGKLSKSLSAEKKAVACCRPAWMPAAVLISAGGAEPSRGSRTAGRG